MTTKRTSRHQTINRTDEVMMEESAKARPPNIKSYSPFQKICLTAVRAPGRYPLSSGCGCSRGVNSSANGSGERERLGFGGPCAPTPAIRRDCNEAPQCAPPFADIRTGVLHCLTR